MATTLLGVDVGTSLIKASFVDDRAQPIASVERSLPIHIPSVGVAEQDARGLIRLLAEMLRELTERESESARSIVAIGVSAQTAGSMAVDREGEALSPWFPSAMDTRAQPQLDRLKAKLGAAIFASNGAWPFTVPRILWWQDTSKDTFGRIACVPSLAGYVVGSMSEDRLEAMTIDATSMTWYGAADIAARTWNNALIGEIGLPHRVLPDVRSSFSTVGRLGQRFADLTGLPAGVPIVNGMGDTAASLVGADVLKPGEVYAVNGSFTNYLVCQDRCLIDDWGGLFQPLASPLPDVWYSLLYIAGGGFVHRRMAEMLSGGGQRDYAALDTLAGHVPAGSNGLWYLPYAHGRFCPWEPNASAGFHGLNLTHERGEMWRAVIEGLTYDLQDLTEAVSQRIDGWHPEALRITGGGANSALWCQVQADMIGAPSERYLSAPSAPIGAALVAGVALGVWPDLRTAVTNIRKDSERFEPDPLRFERYRELALARQSLIETLRPSWDYLTRSNEGAPLEPRRASRGRRTNV
jgi:xylulokinase